VYGYKLCEFARSGNDEVAGHLCAADLLEVRVGIPVKRVGKQLLNAAVGELAWRQAYRVQHNQTQLGARWSRSNIGRRQVLGVFEPSILPSLLDIHGLMRSPLSWQCAALQ